MKNILFQNLTLTDMIKLDGEKEEGFTRNTFKYFIIQLGRINNIWPRSPYDCGQSQPRLPPHITPTTRTLKALTSLTSSHPTTKSNSISWP